MSAVRPATHADQEVVLELVDALADYERLDRPDPAARTRLLADAFGSRQRIEIVLAEDESGIAQGYALFFETYSSFLALPTLYLEDLFVRPKARGQGLGRLLMAYVAGQAMQRGCGRMEWQVLRWNAPTLEFYQRLGAEPLDEWVGCRLSGASLAAAAAP